jgi:hypothetical protein
MTEIIKLKNRTGNEITDWVPTVKASELKYCGNGNSGDKT